MKASGMSHDEAWESFRKQEQDMIDKYGWLIHFVEPDPDYPLNVNYHTHGMVDNLDHPDLQIVVPLPPQVANSLFHTIVNYIKLGDKFEDGSFAEKVVKHYSVKFVKAKENDREVLRIIIPDVDGNLERDTIVGDLGKQYADL